MAKGNKVNAKGRNDSEQYVKLSYRMLRSDAWRSLGGPAVRVYFELRTRYMGRNNGQLTLSLDEGARLLGLGKATVGRALTELESKGFIVMTKRGQWHGRLATEYAITDKPLNGVPATNAWKHWRPEKQILGSEVDQSAPLTGPLQHRRKSDWSATAPVRANLTPLTGPLQHRSYNHSPTPSARTTSMDQESKTTSKSSAAKNWPGAASMKGK